MTKLTARDLSPGRVIYGLMEVSEVWPLGRVFYVGQTKNLANRLRAHVGEARRGVDLLVYRKVRSVLRKGGKVTSVLLHIAFSDVQLDELESATLADLHARGFWLANLTAGGDTSPMDNPETRAKVATSLRGKTLSAEHRAKIAAAKTGKPLSAEPPHQDLRE